jgi:hypothetical protein
VPFQGLNRYGWDVVDKVTSRNDETLSIPTSQQTRSKLSIRGDADFLGLARGGEEEAYRCGERDFCEDA